MKVLVQVWSDNRDHDEVFGTKPNKPHYIYNETVNVDDNDNLLSIIVASLRSTILSRNPSEAIYVMWNKNYSSIEEVRFRIANSEYCCRATASV